MLNSTFLVLHVSAVPDDGTRNHPVQHAQTALVYEPEPLHLENDNVNVVNPYWPVK